jgi:hypothetical protein
MSLEEFSAISTAVLQKLVGRLKHSEEEHEQLLTLCREGSFGHALMTKVNSLARCRHCHTEFTVTFESGTVQ